MDTMSRRRRQKGDPCNCLRPLIRLWGITTAIVLGQSSSPDNISILKYLQRKHPGYYNLLKEKKAYKCSCCQKGYTTKATLRRHQKIHDMYRVPFREISNTNVVCGVGVDITVHGYRAGIYILVSSVIVFFLEVKWIFTLFIQLLCTSNDYTTNCAKCWSICKIVGGWRLSPPYVALGVALIMWPHNLWLSYVAGIQLIVLAVLRLFTIFRYSGVGKDEGLLPQYDDSFDKSDNLSEAVDDTMPEPGHSLEDEEAIDDI